MGIFHVTVDTLYFPWLSQNTTEAYNDVDSFQSKLPWVQIMEFHQIGDNEYLKK